MLKGLLRVIDRNQMQQMHEATLQVLEETGLILRGRFLLEALAEAGCKVDFEQERAWFKPELVEKQIAAQKGRYKMVRSSLWYPFCRELPAEDVAWPDEWCVDFGFGATTIYDFPSGRYRPPTQQDQIDMIRLGNALPEAKAINAPFVCGDVDPRMEVLESSRILLLNTTKPGWVGTSSAKEVKYLAELASLVTGGDQEALRTMPPIFVHANCTTSPLRLDPRSCEVLEEGLKYGFPVNFAPMPILGATTPVTPAGSAVVAAAEILGCLTAATLLDPNVYYYATSIAGEMDMRTTQICYSTPAAILTDAALHQWFRDHYGIVLNVECGYVEAKSPGIQAAFMKTYRQMAFAGTVSASLPIGLLDNGAVFSAAQAMLDLDMCRGIYKFGQGMEVDDESLCLDLINEVQFCQSGTYLESEHTLKHFRNVLWQTSMFDRSYRRPGDHPVEKADLDLMGKADEVWRRLVAEEEPPELDPKFVQEVDDIVEAARKEWMD